MAVVTISRQYGAGGRRVAAMVADALGFRIADSELIDESAKRLGVDPELARAWDERAPAVIEELGLALAAGTPLVGGGPAPQFDPQVLSDQALAEATRRVIESLGEAGGYVVLGRGAQAALHGRPDAAHFSLAGDLADRVKRIMESQGLQVKDAREACERIGIDGVEPNVEHLSAVARLIRVENAAVRLRALVDLRVLRNGVGHSE